MPKFNTDFLKYDARSIKDGIIQKLGRDSNFTDQLFEGSNLTTLVDVFSYMFEVLQYYINHGSTEAIFSDAQLYENMNRIVKMLGYSPQGYSSPETQVSFSTETSGGLGFPNDTRTLPKFTSVNAGITDDNGDDVVYSFIQNLTIDNIFSDTDETTVTMVNGKWTGYERTFLATGEPLEAFTLDLLGTPDDDQPTYVSHPYVDVYIKRIIDTEVEYIPFNPVSTGTLFGTESLLFGPNDRVFELRMNEDKQYEIRFGDGIHGQKLQENDEIYIVYLKGNGTAGQIGAEILNQESDKVIGIAGYDRATMLAMLNLTEFEILSDSELQALFITNVSTSSSAESIESVDSIRQNAPSFFRMGGRLVTERDYKDFVTATFRTTIYDVNVMNNWEYLATFHKWLYDLNLLSTEIREQDYIYADSCDFNNVYLWIKFKGQFEGNIDNIERNLLPRKVLTAEPIIQSSLDVTFVPANVNNNYDIDNWDPNFENWIEILKDKNSMVPVEKLREQVTQTIKAYFDENRLYIGQNVDLNAIQTDLMEIEGVKKISTVYKEGGLESNNTPQYFEGLRFASWTKALVDGADLNISTGNISLQPFQFPVLKTDDFGSRIQVVFESFGQPSVEY